MRMMMRTTPTATTARTIAAAVCTNGAVRSRCSRMTTVSVRGCRRRALCHTSTSTISNQYNGNFGCSRGQSTIYNQFHFSSDRTMINSSRRTLSTVISSNSSSKQQQQQQLTESEKLLVAWSKQFETGTPITTAMQSPSTTAATISSNNLVDDDNNNNSIPAAAAVTPLDLESCNAMLTNLVKEEEQSPPLFTAPKNKYSQTQIDDLLKNAQQADQLLRNMEAGDTAGLVEPPNSLSYNLVLQAWYRAAAAASSSPAAAVADSKEHRAPAVAATTQLRTNQAAAIQAAQNADAVLERMIQRSVQKKRSQNRSPVQPTLTSFQCCILAYASCAAIDGSHAADQAMKWYLTARRKLDQKQKTCKHKKKQKKNTAATTTTTTTLDYPDDVVPRLDSRTILTAVITAYAQSVNHSIKRPLEVLQEFEQQTESDDSSPAVIADSYHALLDGYARRGMSRAALEFLQEWQQATTTTTETEAMAKEKDELQSAPPQLTERDESDATASTPTTTTTKNRRDRRANKDRTNLRFEFAGPPTVTAYQNVLWACVREKRLDPLETAERASDILQTNVLPLLVTNNTHNDDTTTRIQIHNRHMHDDASSSSCCYHLVLQAWSKVQPLQNKYRIQRATDLLRDMIQNHTTITTTTTTNASHNSNVDTTAAFVQQHLNLLIYFLRLFVANAPSTTTNTTLTTELEEEEEVSYSSSSSSSLYNQTVDAVYDAFETFVMTTKNGHYDGGNDNNNNNNTRVDDELLLRYMKAVNRYVRYPTDRSRLLHQVLDHHCRRRNNAPQSGSCTEDDTDAAAATFGLSPAIVLFFQSNTNFFDDDKKDDDNDDDETTVIDTTTTTSNPKKKSG